MTAIIKLKRSATPNKIPNVSALDLGEIAINTNDGRVFIKKDNGTQSILDITKNRGTEAPAITVVSNGATATLNYNLGDFFDIDASAVTSFIIAQSNVPTDGTSIMFIELTAAGSKTITWPSGIKWSNGTVPTFSTTNKDLVALFKSSSGLIGSLLIKNYQ